ncbi:MAG: TrbC/VirB2 family protein [Clostridia bacterium]|nr:TrbC/VirB2 family protein [Clostridia bacterium]
MKCYIKKNSLIKILTIFVIVLYMFNFALATGLGNGFDPNLVPNKEAINGNIEGITFKIWNTITFIVQILAIASIVIAGVRYMFASADKKADLKQGIMPIIIGGALVFAASSIAKFVMDASAQAGIK